MEEKKLSGLDVKRAGHFRIYPVVHVFKLVLMLGCAVALCFAGTAEAARTEIEPWLTMRDPQGINPVLSGIQVSQWGGNMLRIRFRGLELPRPYAVSTPGDGRLVLRWDGARFPQSTDRRDWWDDYSWDVLTIGSSVTNSWWKQYELPLLNRINAEPIDEDGLLMTFITTRPMVIDTVEGVPGSDEVLLLLKIYEPAAPPPPAEPPRVYGPGDPMGITAPVVLANNNAPIRDVFRMLADMHNLNLFLDPSVPDMNITFSFNAVPYNEAFRYLLRSSGLDYRVENNMLIVARPESLVRVLGNEVTRSYRLSYAIDSNGQLRGDLIGSLTGLISLPQTPVLDASNRELYVTTSPEQHREVAALLQRLDTPGRQVMLEARIFEVSDNGRQDLETLVTGIYNHWVASFTGSGLNAGYNWWEWPVDLDTGWSLPIGGSIGGGPALEGFPIQGGIRALSYGLRALEEKGLGKNIANPSVITLDGQTANIDLSRSVSYVTGVDANGNPSISTISYGPSLNFLPVVGRDGVVTIRITIQAGDLIGFRRGGMGAEIPETSNRRVETTVRVRNGEPFVVGGLFQEIRTQSRNRIPVLGYIPFLGDLFTIRADRHDKSEVAIIVIPYILDVPDGSIQALDLRRSSNF